MMLFLAFLLQSAAMPTEPASADVKAALAVLRARGVPGGLPDTTATLGRLATDGDASADEVLGSLLTIYGDGSDATWSKACDHWERVAAKRIESQHNAATCYFSGRGRTKDLARARKLYLEALDRGAIRSGCALGNMMVRGEGGPKDAVAGVALCRASAVVGDAEGQADYGGYLLTGVGVPRDPVAARTYLTAAATAGHVNAAFNLGKLLWNGDGTPKDRAAADRWWRQAHAGGRKDAAKLLGDAAFSRMMQGAKGPRDLNPDQLNETIRWYELARHDPEPRQRAEAAERLTLLKTFHAGLTRKR